MERSTEAEAEKIRMAEDVGSDCEDLNANDVLLRKVASQRGFRLSSSPRVKVGPIVLAEAQWFVVLVKRRLSGQHC